MVRHEAAEALGSIAGIHSSDELSQLDCLYSLSCIFGLILSDEQSIALLQEFSRDPEPIVSQSCEVALSMLEFENSGKSFEVKYFGLKTLALGESLTTHNETCFGSSFSLKTRLFIKMRKDLNHSSIIYNKGIQAVAASEPFVIQRGELLLLSILIMSDCYSSMY